MIYLISSFRTGSGIEDLEAEEMDVLFDLFALGSEGEFFLEHCGGRFKSVGGEDLENLRDQIGDFARVFIEPGESLIEEEEEVARVDF